MFNNRSTHTNAMSTTQRRLRLYVSIPKAHLTWLHYPYRLKGWRTPNRGAPTAIRVSFTQWRFI